jgi:ElaB/YqjD/DUF883 family membrane-anchored ribosome-binding protein
MAERNNINPDWSEPASTSSSTSERSPDEIRQDIAARRESITEAVDRLSDRFQRTFDWRAYVSDHPLVALGVAAGIGFLSVKLFTPRPSPGARIKDALADGFEDLASRFKHQLEDLAPVHHKVGIGATVKAAAAGLITKAATDYVRGRIVGAYEREHDPEYMRDYAEYMGGYPEDNLDYPESEDQPDPRRQGSFKKRSEPRH